MTEISFKKVRLCSSQDLRGPILFSSPGFLPDQKTKFTVVQHQTSKDWIVQGDSERFAYEGSTAKQRGNTFFQ